MKKAGKYIVLMSILITTIPYIIAAFFGIPSADDFSFALPRLKYMGNNVSYIIYNAKNLYMHWQGTYTANVFQGIPVYTYWGIIGLRFEMVLAVLFFLGSLFFFIRELIQEVFDVQDKKIWTLIVYQVVVWAALAEVKTNEIFYWHTGIAGYTIPISCMLLSLGLLMRRNYVCGLLLGVITMGGPINIGVMYGLILVGYYIFVEGKNVKPRLVLGVLAIAFAINVIAPGNYIRKTAISSELHLMKNAIHAFAQTNRSLIDCLCNGWFMLIFFVFFVLALNLNIEEYSSIKVGTILIYSVVALFLVDYPVALGYNGPYFPERTLFVEKIMMMFSVASCSVACAIIFKKLNLDVKTIVYMFSFLLIVMFMPKLKIDNLVSLPWCRVAYHVANGDFKEVSERNLYYLETIEKSGMDEVYIERKMSTTDKSISTDSEQWTCLMEVGLSEDKDYWVNSAVAEYYGKKIVVLSKNIK